MSQGIPPYSIFALVNLFLFKEIFDSATIIIIMLNQELDLLYLVPHIVLLIFNTVVVYQMLMWLLKFSKKPKRIHKVNHELSRIS